MDEDFVVWDDSYSVGFEIIDNQHKNLVAMTNELFQGCKQGVVAADISFLRAIRKAVEYAKTHFSTEESYMRKVDYPNLVIHIKEHEAFSSEVLKAIHKFEEGKTAPIELARFLKKWLLGHIAVADQEYAPYIAKLTY